MWLGGRSHSCAVMSDVQLMVQLQRTSVLIQVTCLASQNYFLSFFERTIIHLSLWIKAPTQNHKLSILRLYVQQRVTEASVASAKL